MYKELLIALALAAFLIIVSYSPSVSGTELTQQAVDTFNAQLKSQQGNKIDAKTTQVAVIVRLEGDSHVYIAYLYDVDSYDLNMTHSKFDAQMVSEPICQDMLKYSNIKSAEIIHNYGFGEGVTLNFEHFCYKD